MRNTRAPWYIMSMFVVVTIIGGAWAWYVLAHQPLQVTIDLRDPTQVNVTQGVDPDGIWFDGNTHISTQRFLDMPWRVARWRWRQPPGELLPITLTAGGTTWQDATTEKWRVVHLLLPSHATDLHVRSDTRTVSGDVRKLGVMMSSLTITRLPLTGANLLVLTLDYWLFVVVAALWLWRARWVGLLVLSTCTSVYGMLLTQEAASGFAHATLLADRTSRVIACVVMLVWAWMQRQRQVDTVVITGRRFGLDVLRAVAIMSVFMAHFTPLVFEEWSSNQAVFRWFVLFGALGVNIFFALSGYLIGAILLRQVDGIHQFAVVKRFWARRWLRTLPAAYVSAAVLWLVAAPSNIRDYLASILFVGTINPLQVSSEIPFWWSLGAEELFYFIIPLVLFALAQRLARPWIMGVALTGIVLWSFASRAWLVWHIPANSWEAIEYVTYTRLDSMVWGILVAWMRIDRPAWFQRLAHIGYAPGLMMVAVGVMLFADNQRWPMLAVMVSHVCMTVGTALLIPAGESLVTLGWRVLDRVIAWIAVISYSLYLYHVMVMLRITRDIGAATSWPMLAGNALIYIVASFGLAAISYYFVEKPVLAWRDRRFRDRTGAE